MSEMFKLQNNIFYFDERTDDNPQPGWLTWTNDDQIILARMNPETNEPETVFTIPAKDSQASAIVANLHVVADAVPYTITFNLKNPYDNEFSDISTRYPWLEAHRIKQSGVLDWISLLKQNGVEGSYYRWQTTTKWTILASIAVTVIIVIIASVVISSQL